MAFEDMSILNRANSLAFYELLGNANLMNDEFSRYQAVTLEDINASIKSVFRSENCNTLRYFSEEENVTG